MSAPDRRNDPPPYAWLDDPSRMAGAVSPMATVAMGTLLVAVGLFAVVLGVFGGPEARVARLCTGLPIALIGAFIVHMGTARRAWRRRNPDADPLQAAVESGANVGSALGNDSRLARVGRWVLVAVCAFVTLVMVLALRRAVSGQTPTSAGSIVVIVLLGLLAAVVGVMAAVRTGRPGR